MDVTKLRFTRYTCTCAAYNEILLSQGGNPDLNHVTKDETRSVFFTESSLRFQEVGSSPYKRAIYATFTVTYTQLYSYINALGPLGTRYCCTWVHTYISAVGRRGQGQLCCKIHGVKYFVFSSRW
jgi:hypothetical protein